MGTENRGVVSVIAGSSLGWHPGYLDHCSCCVYTCFGSVWEWCPRCCHRLSNQTPLREPQQQRNRSDAATRTSPNGRPYCRICRASTGSVIVPSPRPNARTGRNSPAASRVQNWRSRAVGWLVGSSGLVELARCDRHDRSLGIVHVRGGPRPPVAASLRHAGRTPAARAYDAFDRRCRPDERTPSPHLQPDGSRRHRRAPGN